MVGYGHPEQFGPIDLRRRTQALRDGLIAEIAGLFPDDVSIVRPGGRWRSRLCLRNGSLLSILVARSIRVGNDAVRWQIDPVEHEREQITLLARLDTDNRSFLDFCVLPSIDRPKRFHICETDPWLLRGAHLDGLAGLLTSVEALSATWKF